MTAEVWTVVSSLTGNETRFHLTATDGRRDVIQQQAMRGELVIVGRTPADEATR